MNIEFDISDKIGEFTVLIDAFTSNGFMGSYKSYIYSERSFYLNYDIPVTLLENDEMRGVVYVHNKMENGCEAAIVVQGVQGGKPIDKEDQGEELKEVMEDDVIYMPKKEITKGVLQKYSVTPFEFIISVSAIYIYIYIHIYYRDIR